MVRNIDFCVNFFGYYQGLFQVHIAQLSVDAKECRVKTMVSHFKKFFTKQCIATKVQFLSFCFHYQDNCLHGMLCKHSCNPKPSDLCTIPYFQRMYTGFSKVLQVFCATAGRVECIGIGHLFNSIGI